MFYIVVVGISVTSDISGSRAFAALMIQILIFAIIPILAYAPAFFYQYDTSTPPDYSPTPSPAPYSTPAYENYSPPNPEKYRITAYAGSPPQIDGAVTEEDKWHEGEKISIESMGKYYAITTKHDFEYIYILMEWSVDPVGSKNIALRFEQDEGKPDYNLGNGRVDSFYQGSYSAISAANIGYRWTLEWKIPMYSENKYDIHIDRYPTELGFSILDVAVLEPIGIFPPDANNHDPRTWGTMTIVDKRIPYSTNTPSSYSNPSVENDSPDTLIDITVFAGSTPIIDGIKDDKDTWYEGESIRKAYGVDNLTITVKHDFENIYILMELDGQSGSFNQIAMYFEQDKNFPDHNLTSGLVDNYYLGFFDFENSLSDRHYQFGSGYGSNEPQNATFKGVYKNGISILEWQIPMKSGDVHDIYINEFPTNVGFSIIDWKNWREGPRGIWPPNALPYKPETWANMVIVDDRLRY